MIDTHTHTDAGNDNTRRPKLASGNKNQTKYKYSPSNTNTLRLRQNGRHFADDIFKSVLCENCLIFIQISPKLVSKSQINNKPALVQIMVWPASRQQAII